MATYTADAAQTGIQPRLAVDGVTIIKATYIAGGVTISNGDVYQLAKIPHGVSIVDVRGFGRTSGIGTGTVIDFGITGSPSLFGKMSITTADNFQILSPTSLPYNVSLSDDASNQYIVVQATAGATSATATGTFGVIISYVRRGTGGGEFGSP